MDVKLSRHILHRLLVNKHGPQRFIATLTRVVGLEKELSVGLTIHDDLLAELSSIIRTKSEQYVGASRKRPRSKTVVLAYEKGQLNVSRPRRGEYELVLGDRPMPKADDNSASKRPHFPGFRCGFCHRRKSAFK